MKKVRILLRVSSGQQLEADGDLSIQRQLVREYVARHENWQLDEMEYFEGSISGYKTALEKRDTLQKALDDARKGEYDILAVYKDDRIGRRMWEIGAYVMALKSCGVDIYTVKDGCISPESDDIMGQMMLALRYGNAQKSSSDTGMRVRDTASRMVLQGKFMGGPAPYGYRLVLSGEISKHGRALHRLEIDSEQAEVVKYIYRLFLYREFGSARIARTLNEDVYYKEMAPRNTWMSGTISGILSNPVYAGHSAYRRREKTDGSSHRQNRQDWILSERADPSLVIIDREQWERTQMLREERARKFCGKYCGKFCGKYCGKYCDNHGDRYGDRNRDKAFYKADVNYRDKNPPREDAQYPGSTSLPAHSASTGNGKILPLTDVIFCGYCKNRLTNGTRYSYWTLKSTGEKRARRIPMYRCPAAQKGLPHSRSAQVRADEIEPLLFSFLGSLIEKLLKKESVSDILTREYRQEQKQQGAHLKLLQKELSKITQDIEELEARIPDAMAGRLPLSLEELTGLIRKYKEKQAVKKQLLEQKSSEQKTLEQRTSEQKTLLLETPSPDASYPQGAPTPVQGFPTSWRQVFSRADDACKRMLVNRLIERIEITPEMAVVRFRISYPE